MTRRNHGAAAHHSPDRGDLDRLLEAERRIGERLAAARTSVRHITEQAEASAREAEEEVMRDATAERERLRATIEAAYAGKLEDLARETRQRIAAFDDIPAERVDELAAHVVERVVTG